MEQVTYRIPVQPILLLLRSIKKTRKINHIDFLVPNGYDCLNGEFVICVDTTKQMCVAMRKNNNEVGIIYTKYYEDFDFVLSSEIQDTLGDDFWNYLLTERRLFMFEEPTLHNTKHITVQPQNLHIVGHDININITVIRGKIFYMLNGVNTNGVEIFKHIPNGMIEMINNNTIIRMDTCENIMFIRSYMADIIFSINRIVVNNSIVYNRS